MRGVAYDRYGGPEVLTLRDDLPDPPVGPDTVLVRVHAAGVNPVDMAIRQGYLAGAFPHHFPIIPGWDVAGVVEAAVAAVREATQRWSALPVGERWVFEWRSPSGRGGHRPPRR